MNATSVRSADLRCDPSTSPEILKTLRRPRGGNARWQFPPAWLAATIGALGLFTPLVRAATLVHDFYLPMPEAQIKQTFDALETGVGTTLDSTFAVVVTGDGTVICYDQWEDGYEIDLAHPAQASTQIWGDGNNLNGIPPGFANDPSGLPAGTALTLRNLIPLPRNPSNLLFDGRDRVSATKALVISRMTWPTAPGSVLADAIQVSATIDWGTNYISPVGQDLTNAMFQYVALFAMAGADNTSVTIDTDGAGPTAPTAVVLNRGESYLVNGGIKKGASVTATKPIQASLVVGKKGARYASDWFGLVPVSDWGASYATPVPTPNSGNSTYVYLYNPGNSNLTVNYATRVSSGSFAVASNGVYQFLMPKSSGAQFTSVGGGAMFAVSTVAANPGNEAPYDWGFTLLPTDNLTTEAVVGLGLGSSDNTQNGSPVWVSPLAATRLYVDYKGDRAGPLTDPNGGKYDTNFDLVALQSQKIYDPTSTNKSQTGMRVYTVNGTYFSTAWGEDADVAASGNPYIDAGTTVLPFPTPTLAKNSTIVNDTNPPGLSIGDTLEYTIQLDNKGLLPLGNTLVIDTLPTNIVYVPNTTSLDGSPLPDSVSGTPFPLDAPGYTIPVILRAGTSFFKFRATIIAAGAITNTVNAVGYNLIAANVVAPPLTNGTQCGISFTDAGGTPQAAYSAGASIYVTVTDNDANSSSNTVQTMSVVVSNATHGDFELVTLTETGTNAGVFRNSSALPSSLSAGLAQQDGTLNVAAGDLLTSARSDTVYFDSCSASAVVSTPALNKILYLSDPGQALDRVDPVATADGTTAHTATLGSGGGATITTVATNAAQTASGTSLTFSHSPGNGANRLLLVAVGVGATGVAGSAGTVSSVTFGGTAMTLLGSASPPSSSGARSYIYSLLNPSPGPSNVVVNVSGSSSIAAGATTFINVNQGTPLGTFATNSADNGSSGSVVVSSASGELVFATAAWDEGLSNQSVTPAAGQAELWSVNGLNYVSTAASTKAGASSVTNTFTSGDSQEWVMAAVSIKPAAGGGGTNLVTFTQTPVFCQNFTMPSNGVVTISNFVTVSSGSMPANPSIIARLKYGSANVMTLNNPVYNSGPGTLVWSGAFGASNTTIPSGQALSLVISNAQAGVGYTIDYDSSTKPSKILLPASTVIDVNTLGVYDAPYPGGSLVNTPIVGSTLYVRVDVSDPFGSYDISSLGLSLDGPGVSGDINTTLTNSSVVVSNSCSKTYEYAWNTTVEGTFAIAATANEGTEGITDVAAGSVTLIVPDLGTPSTAEFTSGNNGIATNAFQGGSNMTVCVRITDLDKNTNSTSLQTISAVITSTSGDSETVILTETVTNSGIFTACITARTNGAVTNNNAILTAPVSSVLTVTYTDPNDVSDQSTATATIIPAPGVPRVTMNKTVVTPTDGQATVGETVQYNLQVVNSGSTTLTNVSVTDNFTSNKLSYVSASLAPTTIGAGVLTWTNVGPLTVGATTNILVTFTATGTTNSAVNSALANAGGGTTNLSSVSILISHAGLNITKTLLSPTNSPVFIGSNVTFRIVVQNAGDTAIPTLPLEDTFSSGCYSFVSATVTPDGTGAGSLLWNDITGAGSLATNASLTIDVTLKVTGGCDPANNTAHADYAVDSHGDPVPPATSTAGTTTGAARITGYVYNDADTNGVFSLGDTGLSSVTISLYSDPNADGDPSDGSLVGLTTTDGSGAYELLNLSTGAYVVVETDLPGYGSVAPLNNRLPVVFTGPTTNANNNFFDYLIPPISYAIISGTVWSDTNANGVVNLGETGIFNVTIELVQDVNTNGFADLGETVAASTTTATNGTYSFLNVVPGYYVVRETDLYGWLSTADSRPPNDNQIGIYIGSGAVTNGNDFLDFFTGNNPGNDAPVANNDTYSTTEDTPLTVSAPGILANDTDVDGDTLHAVLVSPTTNGVLSLSTNGGFIYTPNSNFFGSDSFTYRANDGTTNSGIATVNITVNPVNDAPVANNDAYTTAEDITLTIPVAGILTNDTDVEGSALTALLVNTTTNGTLSLNPNGGFTYTPNTNFNGLDSFTYRASDGGATSAVATVVITVTPVNDTPVANNDAYSTAEDTVLTIPVAGILTNDTDIDGDTLTALLVATTTNGVLSLSTNGGFVYTPNANYFGSDVFTYRATDGNATSAVATVTITITSVDDLPVANPDTYSVNEDGVLNGNVTTNDVPSGDGGNVWTVLTNVTHGVLSLSTNGTFTYTPTANHNGPDSFTYQLCDADGDCSTATVTITVNSVDDAPVANPDSYAVNEDGVLNGNVTTNDVPSGDGGNVWTVLTNVAHGVLNLSTNGTFTYTPTANYNGPDSFTYQVCDTDGDCSSATVTITVNSVDDFPTANPDSYAVNEDGVLNGNVTTNDVPSGDGGNVWTVLTNVAHGVLSLSTNGTFTYTPTANYNGPDSFTYQVCDADGDCSTATVTITVNSVDDFPTANPDSYAVNEDGVLNGNVTTNDVPSDDGGNVWTVLTNVTHGVLSLSTNGTFTYTPATNYNGPDSFTYQVCDTDGDCSPATVTITVNSVDDFPTANSDSYAVNEDGVLNGNVTTNDVPSGDGGNVWTVLTNVAHGVLNLSTNGTFTYTPTANYNGPDSFTYQVCDTDGDCSSATVTITVNSVDDFPTANPDSYAVNEDGVLNGNVTTNDVPSGDGGNVWTVLTNVTHGVLSLSTNGTFTYTPTVNYNGPDSFTYQVCDADNDCSNATVTITVNSADDFPTANPDAYAVNEDGVLNGNVSTNDVPSGDGGNVWSVVTNAAHGVVTLNTNGTFTYTPTGDYSGPDSFTYQVCDADGDCSSATVTITVNSVDDFPVANPDSYAVNEDGTLNGNVTTNDVPSGDGGNVWSVLTNVTHGVLSLSPNGTFTYSPTGNYNGPDSFTYQVCDADGDCSSATVTITVNSVDDAPVAAPDNYLVLENSALNGNVSTNDSPSGDGGNVWTVLTNVSNGVLSFNPNGTFTYTPATNYNGPDSFTYQVCDTDGDCSVATVTISVSSVDNFPVANPDSYAVNEDGVLNGNVSTNDVPSGDGGNVWSVVTNAAHGVATVNTNGTFTYTPTGNYYGPDSFTYQVCDTDGDCSTATVAITVNSVDDFPVANPDSYGVNEDGVLNGNVTTNDVPSGDGGNVWTVLTNVTHGVLSLSTNGTFTYAPTGNYNGPDSFTYQVCDADGDCSSATVTITVNSADDFPVANPDNYAVNEDGVLNGNVTTNDVPSGDGGNVWTVLTNVAHGVLSLSTNGTFTYTPTANYNGPDSFTYQVCDTDGDCSSATVTITVNSVDDFPTANPDSYNVAEDGTLNGNVTTNDVPSGDAGNVWTVLTNVTHGVLSLSTNGTFTYTPAANYNGPDSFTYQVCDADNDCSTATVTISVSSVDNFPVANSDSYAVNEDGVLNGNVTTNDVPSGDGGNVWTLLNNVAHGVLSLSTNGTFTYTPTANYNGPDSFTYQVCDADNDCSSATVTITVNSVDDFPTANPDSYNVAEDGTLNGNVTTNDVPSGDGGNVWTVLTNVAHGVLSLSTNGTFTYTPTANYNGPDSFTYQVCDTDGDCSTATVTITVNSVDDFPTANPDSYAVNEDGVLNGNVTTNDVPSGDGGNVWTVLTNVTHGVLSLNTNGTFTYTPTGNYNGPDSFTYQVCDTDGDCSSATVTITVSPVNDAPVANPDSFTTLKNIPLVIPAAGILTNDTDVDGGALTVIPVTGTANGSLILNANGGFTYTPISNYVGLDSFTYRAYDGSATSGVATVTINVLPTNTPPTAVNNSYTTLEDTTLTIPVAGILTNDIDPDGDALSALLATDVTHGTLSLNPNGSFTYTPFTNYNGTDTLTYRAYDGVATSGVATVTINITPINDPPIAVNDSTNTVEDVSVTINVLVNDSDPEGTPLTITGFSTTNGVIVNNGTNLVFTPTTNFNGIAVFSYTISDGTNTANASVTVTIGAVNDAPVTVNDAYSLLKNATLTIPLAGILTNDFDAESNPLSALLVADVTHGTLSLNPNGGFIYTPNSNYVGGDLFTYRAYDTGATGNVATVNLTILATNTPPTANGQNVSTPQATPIVITLTGNDPDGDPLTFAPVTSPANGGLTAFNTNTGTITYTPNPAFIGNDSFTFRVNDGTTNSAPATVNISVGAQADIAVFKTGNTNGGAGTNLNFTITVTNLGPSTASNVMVFDQLPASYTFVSAVPSASSVVGNLVTWPAFNLASLGRSNFVLTVMPTAGGVFTNVAYATNSTPDPDPTNNSSTSTNGRVITYVQPLADVAVFKFGPASVIAGSNITYTITVTNRGPVMATNTVASDTLPAGVTFQSASAGGTLNSGIVTWPGITLASGASASYSVTITAPVAAGTLTNVASATSPTPDPDLSNNDGSSTNSRTTTTVTALTDVRLNKSAQATVNAGANFTYTLIASNAGPSTASSLSVTDSLPASVSFVSATGGGSLSGNQVIWANLGSLAAGASTNLTLTVTAPASGTLSNTAIVVTPTSDPTPTNNTAGPVITTVTPLADVSLTKSAQATVNAGANFSYTLIASNAGPSTASSLSVTDSLPAGVTFVSATGGGSLSGNQVIWANLGSLVAGASTNLTLTVTAPASGTLSNTAVVVTPTSDSTPTNNTAGPVITTVTPLADVRLSKSAQATVNAGANFSYTLIASNAGPSTASSLSVTDSLPAGVTFVSATGGGSLSGNQIIWANLGSLVAGASTNLTLTVTAPASGTLSNTAVVFTPTSDPNPTNNTAGPVVTAVQSLADVAVFKYGPASIVAGGNVAYTIVVTNLGPATAMSLSVTDSLPASVTFVSASSGGTLNGSRVIWANLGSLAAGASTNLALTVTAPLTGKLTNIVAATSGTPDPVPANNNGSSPNSQVDTVISAIADIIVGKTGPSSVTTGVNFNYTISVTNLGPLSATNVVVTDLLPTNLVFVSATGGGVLASNVVTWPTIAALANGATTNFIITVRAPTAGNFTNIAVAVATTPDPNPTNNNSGNLGAQVPTTSVPPQFGVYQAPNVFNPQTGLFEQRVTVTNTGLSTVAAFRLLVGNINGTNGVPRTNVFLYNATGTNVDTRPYVQYNSALNPGSNVTLILEFYVPDRKPFTNSVEVVSVLPGGAGTNSGGGVVIDRAFVDARFTPVRFVLEWTSVPGTNYTVIYSDVSAAGPWFVATPSVTANANRVQWYDDGPPKTISVPLSVTNRFYRVISNP